MFAIIFITSVFLSSCMGGFVMSEHFRSQDTFNYHYNLHKIGLLPMPMDDTTNNGTFYSTNYFFKELKKDYPSYKFNIVTVDKSVKNDPDFMKKVVQLIKRDRGLSNETLISTGLDTVFKQDSLDAVFIGGINKVSHQKYLIPDKNRNLVQCKFTRCDFVYFLISLNDGKVIWRTRVIGTAFNNDQSDYPPLDEAISNGIDKFCNSITAF